MRYVVLILLFGCVSRRVATTQTTVLLDGTRSYITGGNGKGYFAKWEWKQIKGTNGFIGNAYLPATQTTVQGSGVFAWQLKVTDNLGNQDSAVYSITIK